MFTSSQYQTIQQLRRDVLLGHAFASPVSSKRHGLPHHPLAKLIPEGGLVLDGVHEFKIANASYLTASMAFSACLLTAFGSPDPLVVVIGHNRQLCTPGLLPFGFSAEQVFYIETATEQDAAWALEECLQSGAATAVFAEINQLNFVNSRRFQLAAEKSGTACFLFNNNAVTGKYNAVQSRWRVRPIASVALKGMPGVGMPAWEAEVLKMRHGHTGTVQVYWDGEKLQSLPSPQTQKQIPLRKAV